MQTRKIKREIVTVFMENPVYFNIPLRKRLALILAFSQQPAYNYICGLNAHQFSDAVT
jgi:hypothetical protein